MIPSALLIDDQERSISSAKRLLENNYGLNVIGEKDPIEGLHVLQNNGFSLLITDLYMPNKGIDGITILKIAEGLYPHIPKIILTGHGHEEPFRTELDRIAYDFIIHKPLPRRGSFKFDTIYSKLSQLITHKTTDKKDIEAAYIARIKNTIIARGATQKEILYRILSLGIYNYDIKIEKLFQEKPIVIRRPIKFI